MNLDKWGIVYKTILFNTDDSEINFGWRPFLSSTGITPKIHDRWYKEKLYPALVIVLAQLNFKKNTRFQSQQKLLQAPQNLKDTFLKFYKKGDSIVIINVSLLATPDKTNVLENFHFYNDSWIPKFEPKNYPKHYEFILKEFWSKNKIYNENYEYLDMVWNEAFMLVWRICAIIEKDRTKIGQFEFIGWLEALAELTKDLISNPIKDMHKRDFKKRLSTLTKSISPYLCKIKGQVLSRWKKKAPNKEDDIFKYRVLDAKDCLNSFFKKYNYNTSKHALELLLIKIYESFANDLVQMKLLSKCNFCGDFFTFTYGKKYCSLKYESKDCAKKARNKKFYSIHRNSILPKAKKITQELRNFYRERGIRK